jgi:U32 family peptidase
MPLPELLAPAGGFDAAVAAFQYGADAVYAGLDRFSARAEAQNLSPERLAVLLAHARSLTPPRKVYCTFNTLLLDAEIPAALETLDGLDDLGVDGVIIQDWGLFELARRHFPRLQLHASTQMAAHSREGVRALAARGFTRVVLARELTLDEIASTVRDRAAEIEVFIHGALCYSTSGICLFSSHAVGRSGNRGRCAYCCRDRLTEVGKPDAAAGHPYSMRDLAWLPHIPALVAAGVASLKIEGRMKSPLYVAAITDLYRRAIDGTLTPADEARKIADIQTIFSRPWTSFYAEGTGADPLAIIDPSAVGHRGTRIGTVQSVLRDGRGGRWLRFRTARALEKHDGLQVEPAAGGQPAGFAVNALRRCGATRDEISLPAGSDVEVELPPDLPASPASGAAIYCSASQAVRRSYPIETVRESSLAPLHACAVTVTLEAAGLVVTAEATDSCPDTATVRIPAELTPARNPGQTEAAVRKAFDRTRDAGWRVARLEVHDPDARYAPPSLLNDARRRVLEALTAARAAHRQAARNEALAHSTLSLDSPSAAVSERTHKEHTEPLFTAKVHVLQAPSEGLNDADELVVQIGLADDETVRRGLAAWLTVVPRDRIRLALPLLVRDSESAPLDTRLRALAADGWRHWECADIAGLDRLRRCVAQAEDITADWSLYALNRAASDFLCEQGITRRVTSPEDTEANLTLCADVGMIEALVFQLTPLFISQTPPCTGSGDPPSGSVAFADRRGQTLHTCSLDGRWITTGGRPFSCADAIPGLQRLGIRHFRCDWSWQPSDPTVLTAAWRAVRCGETPSGSHSANFRRRLL